MPHDQQERPRRERVGLRHRVRYRFDNLLARGTWAALVWLGVVTILAVVVSGLLLRLFGVTFTSDVGAPWMEDTWQSLLRILDPGTLAGDIGWGRRLLALLVTIFGLLIAGTLIGIMATGVEDTITHMRRGRSVVIESDHVVVLGAPERIAPVIRELIRSGAGANGGIVAMADADPADLRGEVRQLIDIPRGSRLVFRSGDPTRPGDLELVRLAAARTLVIVGGLDDTSAVRTTLAVLAATGDESTLPLIVETRSQVTARNLAEAHPARIHPLATDDALARIAAYTIAHPGMAGVVAELTDPRSADLQVRALPDLTGVTFRDLVRPSRGARPVGWSSADGSLHLNPPPDARVDAGDRLVFLAVTSAEPTLAPPTASTAPPRTPPRSHPVTTEHLVVLGWSPLAQRLVEAWAQIASPGSTVRIITGEDEIPSQRVQDTFTGVSVAVSSGDIDDPLSLGDTHTRPTVVLLAAQGDPDAGEVTDAATILRLLPLRRRLDETGSSTRLMVELVDPKSTALLPPMGVDDHVMSRAMAAQLLVQLAEEPARQAILASLYTPARPALRLVPAGELGLAGPQGMDTVVEMCETSGLLAIGWRRDGVVDLDPPAAVRVDLAERDQIVVIT